MPDEDGVDESVRDLWKTITTDLAIPPLLTMPGLLSATELVLIYHLNMFSIEQLWNLWFNFIARSGKSRCDLFTR